MSRFPVRLAMLLVALAALSHVFLAAPALAQSAQGGSQKRIALVVGNAAYQAGPLATAANDAGLVAQTLQAAGFDVVGARDLDEESLRHALRDFVDKASASGPDTVAFVYFAGYGVQLDGENYLVPVDGRIAAAADVPTAALRISDYTRRLASLPLKARFVVLDAARANPFARTGDPLAGGLALTEAEPGGLIAFNAAPGTVGPSETGSYGAYAEALVEMIREGGLQPAELFDRVRLRVSERTKGAEVPWDSARIEAPFVFFERAPDAPPAGRPAEVAALRERPIREIGAKDAYALCLERDTLQGYQEFLGAYPQDSMAKRVRAILAARREALTWRRTLSAGSPEAFWSYLGRYPHGPHAYDARRRLARLAAALEPPPSFVPVVYDVPPPPLDEIVYVDRPVLVFDDPAFDFAPPPPPPVVFLPPRPAYFVELAPPPPPVDVYVLPVPAFVPVPTYVSAPAYVAPPPNAVLYQNIHNTTVINEINAASLRPSPGLASGAAIGAGAAVGAAAGIAAARVALPPAVAQKAVQPQQAGPGQLFNGQGRAFAPQPAAPQAAPAPGMPSPAGRPDPAAAQKLPGANGQPLPQQAGRPAPGPGQIPLGASAQPLPQQAGKAGVGQALPGANGQPLPQQAGKPGAPAAALPARAPATPAGPGQIPMQSAGKPLGPAASPGAAPAAANAVAKTQAAPQPGPAAAAQAAQQQKLQAVQQRQQVQAQRQQAQAQQRQAIAQQRQVQAQQAQAARAERQQQMQAQRAQQQAGRQQQMMQQRQAQAAQAQAARQQQMQAARQNQMRAIQQQQAMQRQMQAQQAQHAQQQAARQQQMMQQRAMHAAPPPRQPPPRCPPGQHCR